MTISVTALVADEGTIVVFEGTDEAGVSRRFAAEHRAAQAIVDALDSDEAEVLAEVESWQLLGGAVR